MPSLLITVLHLTVLAAAVGAVYAGSLANGFVWDDTILFIGKENYASFDLFRLTRQWGNGLEFLPLRDLSYIADHALWGWEAFGFHLTNVLLFVITVIAVYFFSIELLRLLAGGTEQARSQGPAGRAALFLALLFAVHPIQSQVVNFVTCRNVLLSGLFFFLSLLLFIRHLGHSDMRSDRRYYLLSLFFFLLALLSKATVLTLPLILVLLILFSSRRSVGTDLVSVMPFALVSVMFFILHRKIAIQANVFREDLYEFGMHDPLTILAKAVQIPYFYFFKTAVPLNFSAEYDIAFIRSVLHPLVLLAIMAGIGCIGFAWRIRRSHPAVLFGLLWYAATLIPVLNLYPTRPVVADRYAFLPVYGIFLALVRIMTSIERPKLRLAGIAAVSASIPLLAALSHGQNRIWESDRTLWTDAVSRTPRLAKAYVNLGYAYRSSYEMRKAEELFRKAGEVDPWNAEFEYLQGVDAFTKNDDPTAVQWFQKALKRKPQHLRALYFSGLAHERSGDYGQAMRALLAVRESPELDLYNYRSSASLRVNMFLLPKFESELKGLKEAADSDPADPGPRIALASALFSFGQEEEASEIYEVLSRRGVQDWTMSFHLGEMARRAGDHSSAAAHYEKSLALRRPNCSVSCALGKFYLDRRKHHEAENVLMDALRESQSCPDAKYYLALSSFQRGIADKARERFRALEEEYPGTYPTAFFLTKILRSGG